MPVAMREATDDVEAFVRTALTLIEAAAGYAEGGQYDPGVDGKIRRIRVVTGALQSALMNIQVVSGITMPPPTTPQTTGATGATSAVQRPTA